MGLSPNSTRRTKIPDLGHNPATPTGTVPSVGLPRRHHDHPVMAPIVRMVPDEEVLELLDHSYDLVLAGLTRAQREKLITDRPVSAQAQDRR